MTNNFYPTIFAPVKVSERLPEIKINEPIYINGEINYWRRASDTLNLLLDGVPCAGSYILEAGLTKNCIAIEPFGMFFEKDFHRIEWLEVLLPSDRYVFTKEELRKVFEAGQKAGRTSALRDWTDQISNTELEETIMDFDEYLESTK